MLLVILSPFAQKVDSAIHRINQYPVDSAIGFPNTYIIHCIEIYPMDTTSQLLNNLLGPGQYSVGTLSPVSVLDSFFFS